MNTIARPMPNFMLYIDDKIINPKRIDLPKSVSNKLTNKLGMAYMTNHNAINSVIRPTKRFRFFLENSDFKSMILYYIVI